METLERGLLTPKSNVWSFEIVLLELVKGRKNLDSRHPKEERNLVKWSWHFLAADSRLSLIMDPQLKGRFPAKATRMVNVFKWIRLRCPPRDKASENYTRRQVYNSQISPVQEPGAINGKHMYRSLSLNRIITPVPRSNFSPPPTNRPSISLISLPSLPLTLPPRTCSSTLSSEKIDRQESRRSSSSTSRRFSVEGF